MYRLYKKKHIATYKIQYIQPVGGNKNCIYKQVAGHVESCIEIECVKNKWNDCQNEWTDLMKFRFRKV